MRAGQGAVVAPWTPVLGVSAGWAVSRVNLGQAGSGGKFFCEFVMGDLKTLLTGRMFALQFQAHFRAAFPKMKWGAASVVHGQVLPIGA